MTIKERDFVFERSDFETIRKLVAEHTGISLGATKFEMVYSRLAKRLRSLELATFAEYVDLIKRGHAEELTEFVNAITTNLTHFFREIHHFETLKDELTRLLQVTPKGQAIRIWSAGCSTGMEPYSIAMVLLESVPSFRLKDFEVLATDIDSNVLRTADRGVYRSDNLGELSQARLRRWFKRGIGKHEGMIRVKNEVRELVTYRQMNLIGDWKIAPDRCDIIFCRNCLIYFNGDDQCRILAGYAKRLRRGGLLFLGHSESIYKKTDAFEVLGRTTFRRKET